MELYACSSCRGKVGKKVESKAGLFYSNTYPEKCPECNKTDDVFHFPIVSCAGCMKLCSVYDKMGERSFDGLPTTLRNDCPSCGQECSFTQVNPRGTAWDPGT